ALGEIGGDVTDAVLLRDLAGRLEGASDQGHDFDAVDVADGIEMLGAEGAGTGETGSDRHGWSPAAPDAPSFSRIMWPTAVFDAGPWEKRRSSRTRWSGAPRITSHITSSIASEPASRT